MNHIPTDVLRTLVTVVDLRNYTRAAQSLGLTQPAVSTQIKKLQETLGSDLFDKSAPGVRLTREGETVVGFARRILALNDELFTAIRSFSADQTLSIGVSHEFGQAVLPLVYNHLRQHAPGRRVHVQSGASNHLLRDRDSGRLDLTLALTLELPPGATMRSWPEKLVWAGRPGLRIDPSAPVPLVMYEEECALVGATRAAMTTAGRSFTLAATGSDFKNLTIAAAAGFGVMPLPKRVVPEGLAVCNDSSLPTLPRVYAVVDLRDGADGRVLEPVADAIMDVFRKA